MDPNDPVIVPSELVDNVLELLENAGVPEHYNDDVVRVIEKWEESQVVPPSKYENWPPGDARVGCCPEEVSNHVSSTGYDNSDNIIDLKADDIITDDKGNSWKFHKFWCGENIKTGWVPKKGEYYISSQHDHCGEIFQMIGSVVACMTRDRFIIEKVEE